MYHQHGTAQHSLRNHMLTIDIGIGIGPDAHIFKLFGNERENAEQPTITNV